MEKKENPKEDIEKAKITQPEPPESYLTIDKANLAAERLETANRERARLLAIEERLHIEKKLSGESDAGQKPEEKKELTPAEYRAAIEKGEIPK